MHIQICIYIYSRICVYIYIYKYTCVYIHTYIYIYIPFVAVFDFPSFTEIPQSRHVAFPGGEVVDDTPERKGQHMTPRRRPRRPRRGVHGSW